MKTRSLLLPLACFSLVDFSFADTFTLKDGSTLEGKILSETADSYFVEVRVTKSIKDERTLAKADVKSVETEKLDETAFAKIKNLVPTPDLLANDDYDKRILAVTGFLKEHPKSPRAAEANTILSTLKSEGVAILGGGIKLGGSVISAADYKANAYELDAKIIETRAREAAARGDLLNALRGMSKVDTDYRSTLSFASIAPLKKQVLQQYRAIINEQLGSLQARETERQSGLARMSQQDRNIAEQALAEEMDTFQKRYKSEQELQMVWTSTNPYHRPSLEASRQAIETELAGVNYAPIEGDGGKFYRTAWAKLNATDNEEIARELIYKASEYQMPDKYINNLKKVAEAKGVTF